MVSFEQLHLVDDKPIYLQIVHHVKRGLVTGRITDGEEMPSRRVVSALLGVNPNTVQKAYRQLEEEALLQSRTGAKSTIVFDEADTAQMVTQLTEQAIYDTISALRALGTTKEVAHQMIDDYWNKTRGLPDEKD